MLLKTTNYHRERRARGCACTSLCCERRGGKRQRYNLKATRSSARRVYPAPASKKSGAGFTLIELMVVMSIVAFLTTILVGYSRQSGRQLLLSSTEAKILSLVSRAKFLSIETFFKELGSTRKTCAYGIHVGTNEIFIFQDGVPDDGTPCTAATNEYESGANDERLSSELDSVKINLDLMTLEGTLEDIVYIPPDPDVKINNSSVDVATIKIDLEDGSGGFVITVTDSGQVRAN